MTTTTYWLLTNLEIGQKEKEATINTNMGLLDAAPKYLGDAAGNPSDPAGPAGSRYYNTGSAKFRTLRSVGPDVWVEEV